MPHPARVEQAADRVESLLSRTVDDLIAAAILDGTRLPTASRIVEQITPELRAAVIAAFEDIDPDWTDPDVDMAVLELRAEITVVVNRVLREAARKQGQVRNAEDAPRPDDDDGPSVAALIAAGAGFGAAAVAVNRRQRARAPRRVLQRVAAQVGDPLPPRLGPRVKQIIRTRVAEQRNTFAADVADRVGLVIFVEDARKGPTDEECERVNGRYASPLWMRRHPTEHPNCTRRGRPVRLPPGRYVTLLE